MSDEREHDDVDRRAWEIWKAKYRARVDGQPGAPTALRVTSRWAREEAAAELAD